MIEQESEWERRALDAEAEVETLRTQLAEALGTRRVFPVATGEYEEHAVIALFDDKDDAETVALTLSAGRPNYHDIYQVEGPMTVYGAGDRSLGWTNTYRTVAQVDEEGVVIQRDHVWSTRVLTSDPELGQVNPQVDVYFCGPAAWRIVVWGLSADDVVARLDEQIARVQQLVHDGASKREIAVGRYADTYR